MPLLDRRTQTQRIARKAFTRPVPLVFLVIGILTLLSHHWLYGILWVVAYLIISTGLMFSPKFVKRVVDEN